MTTDHAPDHPPVAAPLGDVTTERLTLRRFRAADAEALAPVFAEPAVWRYPYGRGLTAEETATFVEKRVAGWDAQGFDLWVAEERATGRVIGFVGLSVPRFLPEVLPAVEVGWRLHPDVWGRGYATEGATAALDEAFTTLGLDEVVSIIEPVNTASVRVAERLGMEVVRPVTVPSTPERGELTELLFRRRAADRPTRRPAPGARPPA